MRHTRNFTVSGNKYVIGLEVRPIPNSHHYEIWFVSKDGSKRKGYAGIPFMKQDVKERLESIGRLNILTEKI